MITNHRVSAHVGDENVTVELQTYEGRGDNVLSVTINGCHIQFQPRTYGGNIEDAAKALAEAMQKLVAE